MTRSIRTAIVLALLTVGTARADVVVPNSSAGVEGDGTFSLTTTAVAGRTYQLSIAANQLTGLVGQQINGVQWRLNGPGAAAWPPADANYASFDIFVGPGVAPGSASTTFASNFTSTSTQVRSGALTIPAGSYTFGTSPNAFGPTLNFSAPYLYSGGDLTLELRMAQQTGAATQSPFDAMASANGPGNGWGVDFSARFAAGSTATTVTTPNANALVTNFITTAVPEPTTVALVSLSLGGAATWKLARRRRQQRRR
ncbi:MAG: PEP-CTERM sorting domain-containing protein [Gemmatales bacterium]